MATAFVEQLADALVVLLNDPARDWSEKFTAERDWAPEYSLDDLSKIRVTVVPGDLAWERVARNLNAIDHELQIGIQKRVAGGKRADVKARMDAMAYLSQEVADYIRSIPTIDVTDVANGVLIGFTMTIYNPEQLEDQQQFTSVILATYKAYR